VKEEAIYRCHHAPCARALPRRVNFCPYCGTAQYAGVDPAARLTGADEVRARAQPETMPAAVDSAKSMAPSAGSAPAAGGARPDAANRGAGYPGSGAGAAATMSGAGAAAARAASPVPPAAPRVATPARPRQREPVRLRWWLLALAVLWAIWLVARPTDRKINARIDKAIALATGCQAREAQSALIALQSSRATPRQLQRLQQALNDAAAHCNRVRQRARAWREASNAIEAALNASSFDKAGVRLLAFTRRWGEDQETRELKARVDAGKRDHPLAVPEGR
jgi:hypothetical protein